VLETTGSIRTEYPTVMMSYLNASCKKIPDSLFWGAMESFSLNFEAKEGDDSELELVAFAAPRDELLDFSIGHFLKLIVDTKKTNEFFLKTNELGRYAILVNTDSYTYRALVDDSTGEVLEATAEIRNLH